MASLYPSSPKNVPADFTEPSTRYEWQVVFVLGSLLLTLLLYLALVAGSGYLFYYLLAQPWSLSRRGGGIVLRILGLFCSGMLFLYLFKGLFKHQRRPMEGLVEVTEKDQPDLFAFLRQLCAETGAPVPRRVFCSHEVNACVFYPTSLFSLIFPSHKNLLIGLGLMQTLNLTELKALLAHELGHFSQSSMKLGSYVYMANQVLADIVYGRDFLDRFLSEMKGCDERVAIFANLFSVLLGYLRLGMEWIFKGINLLNLSLMRQMEFNADRFAVKAAGSDAVGQVLERCSYADEVWQKLQAELWAASDHQLYSDDIFAHFDTVAAHLARSKKDPTWGSRSSVRGPDAFLFQHEKDDTHIADMWATHPSNHDRERHAKDPYFEAETDERSAWLLVRDGAALRKAVSHSYYLLVHQPPGEIGQVEAARIEQFLREEYAERTYGEQYAGYYDERCLELKELHNLPTNTTYATGVQASGDIEAIHASLAEWMAGHRQRQEERQRLEAIDAGAEKCPENTFTFRGAVRQVQEVPGLMVQVQRELEKDTKVQAEGDARIYLAHQRLAKDLGCAQELETRYQFQLHVQDMHGKILDALDIAHEVLGFADDCNGEMSEGAFSNVVTGLREAASRLNEVSMASTRFRIPVLKNIENGPFLSEFLGLGDLIDELRYRSDTIEGAWVDRLLARLGETADKLQRLHFKSLGGILALQERLVAQWRDQPAPPVEAAAPRPWH